jgi:hypothetical protein
MEQEHHMSLTTTGITDGRAHPKPYTDEAKLAKYLALSAHDTRLARLLKDTRKIGNSCKKAKMSGDGVLDIWYAAIKPRVVDLVGFAAVTAKHESLKTMDAYDIAYQVLLNVLHDPKRFVAKQEQWTSIRLSDVKGLPTSIRVENDLIIHGWFDFK